MQCASRAFFPTCLLSCTETFAWHTFASPRMFTCLVYVSTYCVSIAHLHQNKPFPLLYLGHAQIITLFTARSRIFLPAAILRLAWEQQTHFQSSLFSLRKREEEKRRPVMRLLFAGYTSRGIKLAASRADRLRSACSLAKVCKEEVHRYPLIYEITMTIELIFCILCCCMLIK